MLQEDRLSGALVPDGSLDLAEAPKGDGPFTVFAPTDAAFAKLPAGTVGPLLKPKNEDKLVGTLTYHVVPGKIMSADIVGKTAMVQTLQGASSPSTPPMV